MNTRFKVYLYCKNLDFHRTKLERVLYHEHEIQSLQYKNLGFHSTKPEKVFIAYSALLIGAWRKL